MGTQVRHTIHRKLADGGMAEIYLGTQHGAAGFERPIVIKRIRADFSADPQFRTMLLDEALIAMGLNHSNIVQVLDIGTSEGSWFLVLEMVDGWDVETLMRRARATGHPLPPSLALHVAAEICRALAYAHSRTRNGEALKIVHRDVSPENMLVSEQGEVKLADFGIATAINKRDRTSAGVVKGKLGFMSPEQACGRPLDGRSDIYALGASLYVMCVGERPFQGKTELEVLLRQQEGAYVPPLSAAPSLPEALVGIIQKAMERDPVRRYATADEMLGDVEHVQRTVLGVAGQTELKAWLQELGRRDGQVPTSRRPAAESPPERHGTELVNGTALILEEVAPGGASPSVPPPLPGTSGRPTRGPILAAAAVLLVATAGIAWMTQEQPAPLPPEPPAALPPASVASPDPAPEEEVEVDENAIVLRKRSTDGGSSVAERQAAPSTVSVRFTSEPPGATLIVNNKTFGTTPMSIRFKPGLTHDVVFRKEGFAEESRRVYISAGHRQSVQVSLGRAAAPGAKKKWWQF